MRNTHTAANTAALGQKRRSFWVPSPDLEATFFFDFVFFRGMTFVAMKKSLEWKKVEGRQQAEVLKSKSNQRAAV